MGRRPVRIEHTTAKQRRKRLRADDRTGERPDRRSHRDEVAAATTDERIGEVIGDVVLHGLVVQGRDGAVGERLGPQHGAPQVGHHEREQRQHHRNTAERPVHGEARYRPPATSGNPSHLAALLCRRLACQPTTLPGGVR